MSAAPTASGTSVVPVNRRLHYTFNSATRTIYTQPRFHTILGVGDTAPQPPTEEAQFSFFDAEHINFARVSVRKVIIPYVAHNIIKDVNDRVCVGFVQETTGPVSAEFQIPPGLYRDSTSIWEAIVETSKGGKPWIEKIEEATSTIIKDQAALIDPNPKAAIGHPVISIRWGKLPLPVLEAHIVGTHYQSIFPGANPTTAYLAMGIGPEGKYRFAPSGSYDTKIMADYPADPWQGVRTYNIECNLSFEHMYSTTRNRLVSVVERVPVVTGQPGQNIVYEPIIPSTFIVDSFSTFSLIKFEIRDNLNRIVDLHNQDWSIEFVVEEL